MKHFLTVDGFHDGAKDLRGTFEDRFRDPLKGSNDRFVWDFWSVPDQYRMVRTPAYHYFQARQYRALHEQLVHWGRENLGCHDISPPWLSYYVDGCRQNLHSDVPHGPWAFVYSLSPKKIKYSGGETLILKPETLSYWNSFLDFENREQTSFSDKIASPFNRLTVFDPRFPHGVTEVRGTEDPMEARLVIHGWFVEPRPYVVGALTTAQVQRSLDQALDAFSSQLEALGRLHGTVSFRLKVNASGRTESFRWLTDTLMGLDAGVEQRNAAIRLLKKTFSNLSFPKKTKGSEITIPLLFK